MVTHVFTSFLGPSSDYMFQWSSGAIRIVIDSFKIYYSI